MTGLVKRPDAPDPGAAAAGFGVATAARDVALAVGSVLGLLYLLPVLGLPGPGRVVADPGRHPGRPQAGLLPPSLKLPAGTGLSSLMTSVLAGPGLLIGLAASALVVGGLLLCCCDA